MAKKKVKRQKSIRHTSQPESDNLQPKRGPLTISFSPVKAFLNEIFSYSPWKEALAIIFIVIIGLLVRVEDLGDWKAHPNVAMYKGEPLLTTFDGYYYLTLARDLYEGTYTSIDYKRAVPDYPRRPSPPPLLSVIGAGVKGFTGASFNWVGAVLPAFLGILLALPLYLMARYYGGAIMALTGVLMGLLSHYYIYRSSLGWFDTDCMNVTWAVAAAYCFLKFGVEHSRMRYFYCAGGFLVWILFMWWWDQTPQVATVLSLLPFAVAVVFFYRPSRREGMVFAGALGLLFLAVLAWKGLDFPVRVVQNVLSNFKYISKEASPDFPNLGITISEQATASLEELVAKTTGSTIAFFLSVVGLGLLFFRRPKDSLFLSVPVILAVLSFFFAKRFLIFMSPVTAIGTGFLASYLWRKGNRSPYLKLVVFILVVILAYFPFQKGMEKTFWPKEPPHLIDGMVYASKHTPEDAVIWAWWDHGYPLIYFSRRGTVNDGSAHSPERSVYNGVPLATSNQRFAANFMRFYVARGLAGISKLYEAEGGDKARAKDLTYRVLSVGPEKGLDVIGKEGLKPVGEYDRPEAWLEFFYPKEARPVYLYVDWRLTVTSYWWFWLGTWDIARHDGIHPVYRGFYNLRVEEDKIIGGGVTVDLKKGELIFQNGNTVQLKQVAVMGKRPFKRNYPVSKGYVFELFAPSGYGALMDSGIAGSVFNSLFIRHTYNPRFFKPVRLMTPSYQIWEVMGDTTPQRS